MIDLNELIAWFLERLDADEQSIRAWGSACLHIEACNGTGGFLERFDEERLLAEVAAKRKLLQEIWTGVEDLAVNIEESRGGDDCGARDLRDELIKHLVLPHAGHEGYRDEWRPQ